MKKLLLNIFFFSSLNALEVQYIKYLREDSKALYSKYNGNIALVLNEAAQIKSAPIVKDQNKCFEVVRTATMPFTNTFNLFWFTTIYSACLLDHDYYASIPLTINLFLFYQFASISMLSLFGTMYMIEFLLNGINSFQNTFMKRSQSIE